MYFIGGGMIVVAAALFAGLIKGVNLWIFVNPGAILFIILVVIGVIVATSGYRRFVRGLNAIFSPAYEIDGQERHNAAELYRLLSKCVLLSSLVALIVGVIAILQDLYNVEMLSHAAAAALVAPTYGLILAFGFFEPAVYILNHPRKKSVESEMMEYPPQLGERLLELCIQNGMTPEDIQNATGIELRKD